MPDIKEQRPSEDVRGDAGDMAADVVTIRRASADSVAARDVVIRQGGVRSITARDVVVRQGGVGRLEAQKLGASPQPCSALFTHDFWLRTLAAGARQVG